jgi:hypothetical protein
LPDNIAKAFDAPVVEEIDGNPVSFARPSIDDIAKWAQEIHAARRATAQKLIPKDATAGERYQILSVIEHDVPGPDAVSNQIYSIPGAKKLFRLSLAKSGVDAAEADRVIARIPPMRFVRLALEISGLVTFKDEPAPDGKGDDDPNPPAAE